MHWRVLVGAEDRFAAWRGNDSQLQVSRALALTAPRNAEKKRSWKIGTSSLTASFKLVSVYYMWDESVQSWVSVVSKPRTLA